MKRLLMTLVLAAALLGLSGCALVRGSNRHLSDMVGDTCWPDSICGKALAAPVVAPLWTAALLVDGFIVNPVLSAPKAFTWTVVNLALDTASGPLGVISLPFRVIIFPFPFAGAEIYYCTIPL
ncbi:MAG: hypothetical protein R6V05_04810 [Candidatus Brocadiia bacterium]